MFKLEFDTDNAAFQDDGLDTWAVADVLNSAARELLGGSRRGTCIDSNGNTVGRWELSE